MRTRITPYFDPSVNQTLVRAHAWTEKGYSTKTFATTGEAHSWLTTNAGPKPESPFTIIPGGDR